MKSLDEISKSDHDELVNRVWFNLMRAHRNLFPKIQTQLRKEGMSNPLWHEILLKIEEAGEPGMKAVDLHPALFMSQFNLSRHLSRMEKEGLISKTQAPEDKRVYFLKVTEKGKALNASIWSSYEKIIQEELAHRFDSEEAFELFKGLIKLYP